MKRSSPPVGLRDVIAGDLPIFFEHQSDPEANRMAAFLPRQRAAFMDHWGANILGDDAVFKRTILLGDQVAGHIVCYQQGDVWLLGYWLGRQFWGQGIASRAVSEFVAQLAIRPLQAFVARSNLGSIRVLEKSGFTRTGECSTPARDGGDPIEEFIYTLTTPVPQPKGKANE